MKAQEKLLEKNPITPQDRERLQDIADELSSLPTAERPEDLEAMTIIREAAANIKAQPGIGSDSPG